MNGPDPARAQSKFAEPLTVGFIFREAALTFRDNWKRVLGVGIAVGVAASLLNTLLEAVIDNYDDHVSAGLSVAFILMLMVITGCNSFGSTFLAGVLDKTVGAHQHGHPHIGLWQALVTLPFAALIAADVLISFGKLLGTAAFGVPGIILITLTCITGPVIIIEQRNAVSAIGRSVRLVFERFWIVLLVVTIPTVAEGLLEIGLNQLSFTHSFVGHVVVGMVLEVPLVLFVSLVEVTLAYHLIERHHPGRVTALHAA